MIELRYYTYPSTPFSVDGNGKTVFTTGVRRLQYRTLGQKFLTTDLNGYANGYTQEWSEWQEVPEVTGQSADIESDAQCK